MIKEGFVRELRRLLGAGKSLLQASRMTEMTPKTARKYRDNPMLTGATLSSADRKPRSYRTRRDPFATVWEQVQRRLENDPSLKPYALFQWLQATYPDQFPDTMRRTFERRVSHWKKLHGRPKNVMIEQIHQPGALAASDFTVCNSLGVTIAGAKFDHTLYHCVLTYSNYESAMLCRSESFEALSAGLQNAFFQFGGVPKTHRTDSLAAAIRNNSSKKDLTERYEALLGHYGCDAHRTNARCANENGDVESLNGKLKDRIDQALRIRGNRDFATEADYVAFIDEVVAQANRHRQNKFLEDQAALSALPAARLDTDDYLKGVSVSAGSTIRVRCQVYSVPSRLIGWKVNVRVTMDSIIVSVGDTVVETIPRLIGKKAAAINYRHIIDSLVRKPGSFAGYRYHEQMFPRTIFRIAYDALAKQHSQKVRDTNYLQILHLAATESEDAVAAALTHLIDQNQAITVEEVKQMVAKASQLPSPTDVHISEADLGVFDCLIFNSNNPIDKECPHGPNQIETFGDNQPASPTPAASLCPEGEARDDSGRALSGTSAAELSGALPELRRDCDHRESLSHRLSLGTDQLGTGGPSTKPRTEIDDAFEAASGQDVGQLSVRPITIAGSPEAGSSSGGEFFGPEGERADFWEAGFGEESRPVCVSRAIGASGTQCSVYDLQPAGTATLACQERAAIASTTQDAVGLRGVDHRRLGLRAAKPRGDGGVVYAFSGALRARERDADQQLGIQQVGPNIQGRHDDCSRHRPLGPSQCDYRDERGQLPFGNGQEAITWSITSNLSGFFQNFEREF